MDSAEEIPILVHNGFIFCPLNLILNIPHAAHCLFRNNVLNMCNMKELLHAAVWAIMGSSSAEYVEINQRYPLYRGMGRVKILAPSPSIWNEPIELLS